MSSWRSLVLLISLGFVHFSGKYQVLHPYEIAGRTMAEHIVRAFWKEAPYMEAVSQVSAAIWVTVFALTIQDTFALQSYESYIQSRVAEALLPGPPTIVFYFGRPPDACLLPQQPAGQNQLLPMCTWFAP